MADRGWAILTRDRMQEVNAIELTLLYRFGAKRYLIAGAALTGQQIADRIIRYHDKIAKTHARQPAPFVYSIFNDRLALTLSSRKMRDRVKKLGMML